MTLALGLGLGLGLGLRSSSSANPDPVPVQIANCTYFDASDYKTNQMNRKATKWLEKECVDDAAAKCPSGYAFYSFQGCCIVSLTVTL